MRRRLDALASQRGLDREAALMQIQAEQGAYPRDPTSGAMRLTPDVAFLLGDNPLSALVAEIATTPAQDSIGMLYSGRYDYVDWPEPEPLLGTGSGFDQVLLSAQLNARVDALAAERGIEPDAVLESVRLEQVTYPPDPSTGLARLTEAMQRISCGEPFLELWGDGTAVFDGIDVDRFIETTRAAYQPDV
jgi:hypothetical protein